MKKYDWKDYKGSEKQQQKKGKKYKIQAKKLPASSTAKIMYRSSNKKIAKVTKKGVIKALKKGKCKITVKTSDGKKKVIIVKVK